MYSTFDVNGSGCMVCNNGVMGELGKLQGVFGAEVDFAKGRVVVSHTDEVSREDIAKTLNDLGFSARSGDKTNGSGIGYIPVATEDNIVSGDTPENTQVKHQLKQ